MIIVEFVITIQIMTVFQTALENGVEQQYLMNVEYAMVKASQNGLVIVQETPIMMNVELVMMILQMIAKQIVLENGVVQHFLMNVEIVC